MALSKYGVCDFARSCARTGCVKLRSRPLALVGDLGELAIGVDGVGVPDRLEHRDVGLGVGVREGLVEVDVALLGQLANGDRLVLALGEELHLAGELAVFVDLRARRDRAGDAEQFGERFDDLGRRHAHEPDLVALGQVVVDELERLFVDQGFDDLVDRLGDEFLHLEVVPALGDLQDRFADLLELLLVGAESIEHHLTEHAPDQGATVQQPAGVEFRDRRPPARTWRSPSYLGQRRPLAPIHARSARFCAVLAITRRRPTRTLVRRRRA